MEPERQRHRTASSHSTHSPADIEVIIAITSSAASGPYRGVILRMTSADAGASEQQSHELSDEM